MRASSNQIPIIVGCGYLGQTLSKLLADHHHQVTPIGIVRSEHSYQMLQDLHVEAVKLDLDQNLSTTIDPTDRNIYYFAPPSSTDDRDHRIQHFLQICQTGVPRRFVYISTSGVYGDCNGEWIDEARPCAPITSRAKRRLDAEQTLIRYCQQYGSSYIILRVGGIYGPDRLPISRLKDTKVICPDEAPFSNRIHVFDLAKICHTAMESKIENEVFNVTDGHPTSMTDYFYQISDKAGLPRPECVPMSQAKDKLSPGMFSFVTESRRLSIEKMKSHFNVQLQFPTLTSGLEDCFNNLPDKKM